MNRYAAALIALLLAACAQTPTSTPPTPDPAVPAPTPDASRVGQEVTWGLAPHADGVYTVGWTTLAADNVSLGSSAGFIRKYDTAGKLLWSQAFGVENGEYGAAVASDASGNAYVTGLNGGGQSPAKNDVFLRKFSPDGQELWQRRFGSADREEVGGIAVFDDVVYVVGSTRGDLAETSGGVDAFIRKYTTSGDLLWTRQFGTPEADVAYDVAVDSEGYAYVTGLSHGSLTGAKPEGTFLRRYNRDGSAAWTRQVPYGGSQTFSKVAVRGDDVYLGFSYAPVGKQMDDIRLLRLDRVSGQDAAWAFDYTAPSHDVLWDLSVDEAGDLYIAGYSASDELSAGLMAKVSALGSLVWEESVVLPDSATTLAVLPRAPGEVYGAGQDYQRESDSSRAFLRRFDGNDGSTVWNAAE